MVLRTPLAPLKGAFTATLPLKARLQDLGLASLVIFKPKTCRAELQAGKLFRIVGTLVVP